jgi:hypothetical protein
MEVLDCDAVSSMRVHGSELRYVAIRMIRCDGCRNAIETQATFLRQGPVSYSRNGHAMHKATPSRV